MKIKEFLKTPSGTAALAGGICGVVTHLYGLVNTIHNYDDIAQQPTGYGTGITSGRWFLSVLGDLSEFFGGNYNLTYVNGILFLLLLALAAGVTVSVLGIRNRNLAALVGMLFVVFPPVFSTMAFRYTAVYYGVAILLSAMAAYVMEHNRFGILLSGLCTACSLGIYQAYVPLTISIFVLLLIRRAIIGEDTVWTLIRKGLVYCAALIMGLVMYVVLLKIGLGITGEELSGYQGIDQMGVSSLANFPRLLKETVYLFCMMPLRDYCGLAGTPLIKLLYLLLGGASVLLLSALLRMKVKDNLKKAFVLVLCALFPIAANFVVIMCSDSWLYTLMLYGMVMVPCLPILLADILITELPEEKRNAIAVKAVALMTAALIGGYAYGTNVHYMYMHYATRQTENYLSSLVTQVRMTEGFDTDKEWAMIGDIEDPLLRSWWQYEMDYSGIEFTQFLINRATWVDWVRHYYGYTFSTSNKEEILELSASEEVRQMPCWPNEGSIKVIGDRVVIKCQEHENLTFFE